MAPSQTKEGIYDGKFDIFCGIKLIHVYDWAMSGNYHTYKQTHGAGSGIGEYCNFPALPPYCKCRGLSTRLPIS